MTDNEQNLLAIYRELHDWLSDLAEDPDRRLNYQTDEIVAVPAQDLVAKLIELASLEQDLDLDPTPAGRSAASDFTAS